MTAITPTLMSWTNAARLIYPDGVGGSRSAMDNLLKKGAKVRGYPHRIRLEGTPTPRGMGFTRANIEDFQRRLRDAYAAAHRLDEEVGTPNADVSTDADRVARIEGGEVFTREELSEFQRNGTYPPLRPGGAERGRPRKRTGQSLDVTG